MRIEIVHLERKYQALRIADARRQARLAASLLACGQQVPVLVVPGAVADGYILIDGYARVGALRELARDEVDAAVLTTGEIEALLLGHALTARRRSALEEAWLVRELVHSHGLRQRDVAARLQRSTAWVSRRLALLCVLPDPVQQAVSRGLVPPTAAMKFLAPLSRGNADQAVQLVAALGDDPVSVRDLSRLYTAWRRANASTRARIAAQPRLYLKADDECAVPEPPEPGDGGAGALRADLETLAGVAHRARRRVRDGVLVRADETGRAGIRAAWSEAQTVWASLTTLLTPERPDAGPGHAHGDPAPSA